MINDELSVRCACFFCRKSCIFVEWAAAIYHFNAVYGTDSERLAAVVFPQCDGGKIELCGCCTANNSMFIQLVALWDFCRWENGFSSFLWILRKANKYFFIENKKRKRGASWCFTLAHSCVMCRLKCICVIATQSWVSRQIHNSLSDRIILIQNYLSEEYQRFYCHLRVQKNHSDHQRIVQFYYYTISAEKLLWHFHIPRLFNGKSNPWSSVR